MILARLSRGIRRQNWIAVTLELVIVIAGVVIGFQITGWNAERQDREREALILCRLASDFDLIDADLRQHLADAQASQRMAEAIVTAARRGMTPDDLDALDITQAFTLRAAPAGSPTYAQLVSSGDMALIRSEPVRRSLIDFHEQLARFQRAGDTLDMLLFDGGSEVVDFHELSSDAVESLPERFQANMRAQLESTEFFLAARRIYLANVSNLDWKTTLAEAAERVDAVLAEERPHCPAGAAP